MGVARSGEALGYDRSRASPAPSVPVSEHAGSRTVGTDVRLAGIVAAGRTTHTKKGEQMAFLTLSDEDGLFEVTLFPDLYRKVRARVSEAGIGPFLVEGRVEDSCGAVSVTATALRPLGASATHRAA